MAAAQTSILIFTA